MEKISAVYKITNTVTGDFYVGSSKNVKSRWTSHKCLSVWKKHANNPMYLDMKKFGIDKFELEILEEVEIEQLKEVEQQFIEKLQPTYNNNNAKGVDIERYKKTHRKASNNYENQLCYFNNEVLTLATLSMRFIKAGIKHPTIEAKKYLIRSNIIEEYRNYSCNQGITEDDF